MHYLVAHSYNGGMVCSDVTSRFQSLLQSLHHVSDIEIRPGLPSFDGLRTAPRMGHWGSHCVALARWQDVTGEVEWMSEMRHHWRARLAASTRSMLPTCRQMSALLRSWRHKTQDQSGKDIKDWDPTHPKTTGDQVTLRDALPRMASRHMSEFVQKIYKIPNQLCYITAECPDTRCGLFMFLSARLLLPSLKSGCSSPTAWLLGGKGKCPREQQCTQSKLDFLGRGTSSTAALHVDCWDWASSQGFVLIGMWQLLWRYINAVTRCGRQQQWCIDVSRRSCNFPESFA